MKGVRTAIADAIAALWGDALPVLTENSPTDTPGLADGYLRYAIAAQSGAGLVLGNDDPVQGEVIITLALPIGAGVAGADDQLANLMDGLRGDHRWPIRFDHYEIASGYQRGPYWMVECTAEFFFWQKG